MSIIQETGQVALSGFACHLHKFACQSFACQSIANLFIECAATERDIS